MSITNHFDVIVIGGGPGGMMTAGRSALRGLRVLLIEKNDSLGKKLSLTGGGRCNITNAEFDTRALLKNYGDAEHFLYSPFSQFDVQSTFDFFESKKLPFIIEDRKRAFPKTEKATDVTRVMKEYVEKSGTTILLDTEVQNIKTEDGKIVSILTDKGMYTAKAYVLATGGKSYAETGSTGEGLSWLTQCGHTVHPSNPNLVPLMVKEKHITEQSGLVFENIRVSFIQNDRKIVKQGNILITHFGFSGPLILNSAYEIKKMLQNGEVSVLIDLLPGEDVGPLRTRLNTHFASHPNKTLTNSLSEWFSKGIVSMILQPFSKEAQHTMVNGVTREVRHAIVDRIKNVSCTITGTMGNDWAIISDGGVDLKEIDTRTMQSRLHSNLYMVGDVLHVNRPSGGFSLQLCWTTGWVAGNHVCE